MLEPLATFGAVAAAVTTLASGPFETAVMDPVAFDGPDAPAAFATAKSAGAKLARLPIAWRSIAPAGASRPAGFDAANPTDPLYRWERLDRQVRLAVANGLEPIVGPQAAPEWAERGGAGDAGTRNPDPREYGLFAQAAARRYSGRTQGLPRVRYWQAWNEPNLDWFLMPQFDSSDRPLTPAMYRDLVNAFADGVKSVHADNLVLAGGLSPFGDRGRAVSPLRFMREFLCVALDPTPRRTCDARVRMDVWAHHPYGNGNAYWKPADPDAGAMGNLPDVRRTLLAAASLGQIDAPRLRFWVTEFSWDTRPPDPGGVPPGLHARWVAEAFFRMWQLGVSMVTWFTLEDERFPDSVFQSGLYYAGPGYAAARAKPALRVFRFPFAAVPNGRRIRVWGRAPLARRAKVAIEQRRARGWIRLGTLRSNRWGVFTGRVAGMSGGEVRARTPDGHTSVPFALKPPAGNDLTMATPFGTPPRGLIAHTPG